MFFLFPYGADVTMYRWPVANFLLLGAITMVSIFAFGSPLEAVEPMVLDGWGLSGLFGHVFLHGGIMHLLGNMMFLWAFGNAVCAKVGNVTYFGLFFLLGAFSGICHNLFEGGAAIGASGAVNGIVGLFLVYFPRNNVHCFWLFFAIVFIRSGTFAVSSAWMILLWLAFDLWGAFSGGGGVAYWAHLGGIFAGIAIGVASLKYNWVEMTRTECSLLEVLSGGR